MTKSPVKLTWEETGGGNVILQDPTGTFYVSYNPDPSTSNPYSSLLTMLGSAVGINDRGEWGETAICMKTSRDWYILKGDHRSEYEVLVPRGLEACMKYYKANHDLRSDWSTDEEETANTEI